MTRQVSWVFVALAMWLVLVAVGIVMAAHSAGEPPFWDALSYVEKSRNFWVNVFGPKWENPFALKPTIRPPGVIPFAFPLGFSYNWHRFYARMAFAPILLLALAAIIAGWQPGKSRAYKFALVSLSLVLAGMPFLYQFQPNAILRSQSNWGLVDGLLAGLTALAMAAAIRSVRLRSIGWSVVAALVAAYGLCVKPSGLILMGLVGVAWLALIAESAGWSLKQLRDDTTFRRYVAVSLGAAAAIYLCVLVAAFTSPYYSPENIEFGIRNLKIFHEEVVYAVDPRLVAKLLHCSVGWPVLAAIVLGIVGAVFARRHVAAAVMSLITVVAGVWFWIFTTNIGDVRYFMPFVTVAFVLAIPRVLDLAERMPPRVTTVAAGLAAIPTLLVTMMLLLPVQPVGLQKYLGVNLFTNLYQAENTQAANLLADLKQPGADVVRQIYVFDTSYANRSFSAVLDYYFAIAPKHVWVRTVLPVDWQRGLAYRCDEIVQSDYLVFQLIPDPTRRYAILAKTVIDDYDDQTIHMNAWASTLGPEQGVEVVSETRLRLLRVIDRTKLAAALQHFTLGYTWPKPFRDNNDSKWWATPDAPSPG